jgi:hypothetical protein
MRAFREVIGGLALALIALCTVVGGLMLALNERGSAFVPRTLGPTLQLTLTPDTPSPTFTASPPATATPAPTRSPTPTRRAANPGFTITSVTILSVTRDSLRPDAARVTLQISFTGGSPPFAFYDDDILQVGNPYRVSAICGGAILHTARIVDATGQTASHNYVISPVNCP